MRAFLRRAVTSLTHSGPGYDLPQPARGDHVETWLKTWRDAYADDYGPTPEWYALDRALNDYRSHAETRTPLDRPLNTEVPF